MPGGHFQVLIFARKVGMKVYKRALLKCLYLIAFFAGLLACNPNSAPALEDSHSLADSLIQIQVIKDRFILASFGVETISAINTEKGIVLIDAGISTELTNNYKQKIEQKFQSSHFSYVINTHADHDHCRGNSVFPTVEIVGHENGPEEMEQYWKHLESVESSLKATVEEYELKLQDCPPNSEEWYHNFTQKIRYEGAYRDVKKKLPLRKPDLRFSDSLTLNMGDLTFELKYFGKCHSNSDILIYIPELNVLFVGDLMFQYGRPSIRDKSMADKELWHKAIVWIEKRTHNIETVIGGHGQVFAKDELIAFNKIILEK